MCDDVRGICMNVPAVMNESDVMDVPTVMNAPDLMNESCHTYECVMNVL